MRERGAGGKANAILLPPNPIGEPDKASKLPLGSAGAAGGCNGVGRGCNGVGVDQALEVAGLAAGAHAASYPTFQASKSNMGQLGFAMAIYHVQT